MTARLSVTVRAGDRCLCFEIADDVVTVVEAPDGCEPRSLSADSDGVLVWLPATAGADFAITAELRTGSPPS
jgi:hypothetical protein